MKQITAVIKPFKLEEVREALAKVGVTGPWARSRRGLAPRWREMLRAGN